MNEPDRFWQPQATPAMLRRRAALLARIRDFFASAGVLEVDTPTLGLTANPDPAIESLIATGASQPGWRRYLQTSPEFAMKRLLASGSGDIFQLGHVFRDGERGRMHLPEFTLLEWYRLGYDEHRLMDEVTDLLRHVGVTNAHVAQRRTYAAVLREHAGVCPFTATESELRAALRSHGIEAPADSTARSLLDLLMGARVGPRLGHGAPCFVHDYPADQAALAELNPGDPPTAARFEVFLHGMELANGFRELADANEQRRRFAAESARRAAAGQTVPPLDARLIAALAHGLPACAGVALGVDRLLMVLTDRRDIRDVVALWDDD